MFPVGPVLVGASGDYSDFQFILRILKKKVSDAVYSHLPLTLIFSPDSDDAAFLQDGYQYTAPELFEFLCRVMYERRSKVNPLWARVVMAGSKEGKPSAYHKCKSFSLLCPDSFLGTVDLYGTHYISPTIATGYGEHMAQPILRKVGR